MKKYLFTFIVISFLLTGCSFKIHVLLPSYQLWQREFHNNVNVGDKFLTGITNRYTRQSTDYSLQYKEFHFIPPALVVVEISTHLVRFPL